MAISLEDFLGEESPFRLPGGVVDLSVILRDARFVLLEKQDSVAPMVATRKAAIAALIRANFRASRLPGQVLPTRDLLYWMGWPEIHLSEHAIQTLLFWGRPLGLLSPAAEDGALSLPLSSFVHDATACSPLPERLKAELYIAFRTAMDVAERDDKILDWDLRDYLLKGLVSADQKVMQVLCWRLGIRGAPMTLEQIGKKLGISRERVRQIEGRIKQIRLRHREICLEALALDFVATQGARVIVGGDPRKTGWILLAELLELNVVELDDASLMLIGFSHNAVRELNLRRWNHRELFGGAALRAITEWKPGLRWEDVKVLRDHFQKLRLRRMNITERVYVALEHLGRPAHYSEVGAVYRNLFGDSKMTDRNIHATLGRMPAVAYVGRKGVYGLIKDGAVRPVDDLHSLVPEILRRRFALMAVALPFEVILGEVRKERPGADANSVKLILNMRAVRDADGRWKPVGAKTGHVTTPILISSRFAKRKTK